VAGTVCPSISPTTIDPLRNRTPPPLGRLHRAASPGIQYLGTNYLSQPQARVISRPPTPQPNRIFHEDQEGWPIAWITNDMQERRSRRALGCLRPLELKLVLSIFRFYSCSSDNRDTWFRCLFTIFVYTWGRNSAISRLSRVLGNNLSHRFGNEPERGRNLTCSTPAVGDNMNLFVERLAPNDARETWGPPRLLAGVEGPVRRR